jgi:hypothetical protein
MSTYALRLALLHPRVKNVFHILPMPNDSKTPLRTSMKKLLPKRFTKSSPSNKVLKTEMANAQQSITKSTTVQPESGYKGKLL